MKQKHFVIAGGGAAGFFCAVNAARLNPALKVTILEKSNKLLSKVKVSGGGRCNTTHACFDVPELPRKYPRGQNFLKKTFHWFNPSHTVEWFAERGVTLKTEKDGRMFPDTDQSATIIQCLLQEASKYGVEIRMQTELQAVSFGEKMDLSLSGCHTIEADYLCIACGGYPKSLMFDWLRLLGHTIEPPVPSLFTFNMPGNAVTALMGVSVENVIVKIRGTKLLAEGPLLITHWGMSGPAILRLSAWGARQLADMNYSFTVQVNWVPSFTEQSLREEWSRLRHMLGSQKLGGRNPFSLPSRLWLYLLACSEINDGVRWSDLTVNAQNNLLKNLTAQEFVVNGKTTFKEEFVTCGGVRLSEIDPNTMQSRIHPRLYFAGEVMDVDGITGGFNFQHAWTSGWLAARVVAAGVPST